MLKVRCPNCGLKASGDYCQWCYYPILRGRPTRGRKAKQQEAIEAKKAEETEKRAKIEAERAAKEKVRQEAIAAKEKEQQEAIEAKKAEEAEKRAKIEAEVATREKAIREAKKRTKQLESIREELHSGKIGTKEAIERFKAVVPDIELDT